MLGIFAYSTQYNSLQSKWEAYRGKNITVRGQISGDILRDGNICRYMIYADSIEVEGIRNNSSCRIMVVDYRNNSDYIIPFNEVEISGVFETIYSYKNTLMSDYKERLFTKGICGTMTAYYSSNIKSVPSGRRSFHKLVYSMKMKAEDIIERYVNESSYAMMKGILFGDISQIGEDKYNSFKKSGVAHIFAVSGYNIWLIYFILVRIMFFLSNHNRLRISIILTVLLLYGFMSGWTSSVVRAFIMALISLLGKAFLGRNSDSITSLSVSALSILIANPLSIMDIGFQLSFLSVLSIILILPVLQKVKVPIHRAVRDAVNTSLSVQAGLLPLTARYFNNIPMLSVFSNIIIVPLASMFTILCMALLLAWLILPYGAPMIGIAVDWISSVILFITSVISSIPYSSIDVISPGIVEIMLYYVFLASISVNYRGHPLIAVLAAKSDQMLAYIRKKAMAIIPCTAVCLIMLFVVLNASGGRLKISFIDVGQGDSILITTPDNKHILIDGGGKPKTQYSDFDIGEEVLKPYLLKHGIKKLDIVVSTHSHDDHLLGLVPVMKSFEVGKFIKPDAAGDDGYEPFFKNVFLKDRNIVSVKRGDVIKVGRHVVLHVLNPGDGEADENNSSLVLKVVYGEFSVLLTGDMEAEIGKVLKNFDIGCDVLKIPHHGSRDAMDEEFLDKANPCAAVICVGKNSFGHPDESILDMIEKRGVKLYRTDRDGEVIITTNGRGFKVKTAV